MDANNDDQDHGDYERRRSRLFALARIAAPATRVNQSIRVSTRDASLREELADSPRLVSSESGELELRSFGSAYRLWSDASRGL